MSELHLTLSIIRAYLHGIDLPSGMVTCKSHSVRVITAVVDDLRFARIHDR